MSSVGPAPRGNDDSDRRTPNALQAPDVQQGRGKHRPGRSRGDDRVGLTRCDAPHGRHERRVGLGAHGLHRVVLHLDHVRRLERTAGRRCRGPEPVQHGLDLGRSRGGGASDDLTGSTVAAHRVDGHSNHVAAYLKNRDLDAERLDVPALVRLAVRADAMRELRLPAIRAYLDARDGDPVLRAALVAPRLGRFPLGDSHERLRSIQAAPFSHDSPCKGRVRPS